MKYLVLIFTMASVVSQAQPYLECKVIDWKKGGELVDRVSKEFEGNHRIYNLDLYRFADKLVTVGAELRQDQSVVLKTNVRLLSGEILAGNTGLTLVNQTNFFSFDHYNFDCRVNNK